MNIFRDCHIRNLISSKKLSPFHYNEHLVAVDQKQRKKLFKLKINGVLEGHTGKIHHQDVVGFPASWSFRTHRGSPVTIQRPSLEEYVLLMRRGANIMYPKDIWALIGMLDLGLGSKVIEAGTGSGALTLYLSRTVGPSGRVMSFDVRKEHLDAAMTNCREWDNCLRCRGDQQLTDNIEFHNGNLNEAEKIIKGQVDAVALDLPDPPSVIECIPRLLKPYGACVLYLPNISQVIQLSKFIRKVCLPLLWDTVEEVVHRQWTVQPALLKKNKHSYLHTTNSSRNNNPLQGMRGKSCSGRGKEEQMAYSGGGNGEFVNESHQSRSNEDGFDACNGGHPKNYYCDDEDNYYIARPSHLQKPHTGGRRLLRE